MKTGNFTRTILILLALGMFISVTAAGDALAVNYTITATNSTGGTINPSGPVEVAPGANLTFVMTPDQSQLNCWGGGKRYLLWNYTVDGVDSGWVESFDPVEYTFTAIDSDHTIHAAFTYGFFDIRIFAEFAANTTSGPVPLTVNFTKVHVSDNTGVLWSFGDNATSTEQNPVHTYTSTGVYDVTFTIFCNNSSYSELPLVITVREPPVANFTVNRTFGFPPMTVQFTDTSTGSPPLNYSWDFGDSTTSPEQNPVHTYTAAGSYPVSLTVSNSAGNNTRTADQPIDVLGPIGGDKGYYLVHCNVDGASVFLNDYYKGMTRNGTLLIQVYTTATPYFTYTVEKDGYETFTAPITKHPAKGQTVDLYANLTPAGSVGSLYVTSYPAGATILINGTDRGTTNKFVYNVPAGVRNLTLTRTGYQPYTMLVTVPAGGTKVLAPITLTKGEGPVNGTGTLYIASYPTNATILINGTDRGRTNQFVYNVPAGVRNLTLTRTGYQPYTMLVTVPRGGTKVLAPITLSAL